MGSEFFFECITNYLLSIYCNSFPINLSASACRVLDEDKSGVLNFREFLQAIDLVGAR